MSLNHIFIKSMYTLFPASATDRGAIFSRFIRIIGQLNEFLGKKCFDKIIHFEKCKDKRGWKTLII